MPLSDFDFQIGRFTIRNRALRTRLRNAQDWSDFAAAFECRRVGRLGNIAQYRAVCEGVPIEGVSVRLYDPANDQWIISWSDSARPGTMQPTVRGSFTGDTGVFYGKTMCEGSLVRVRLRWQRSSRPRFEQAYSLDSGRTWETNWYMSLEVATGAVVPRWGAAGVASPAHRASVVAGSR
jgi:hypothetical protein